jgi:hypothetical protein
LDNSTINENKIRKNKSTSLIISVIFIDQSQFTATQKNPNYSDILNEDSVKIIELPIEFSDKYHE